MQITQRPRVSVSMRSTSPAGRVRDLRCVCQQDDAIQAPFFIMTRRTLYHQWGGCHSKAAGGFGSAAWAGFPRAFIPTGSHSIPRSLTEGKEAHCRPISSRATWGKGTSCYNSQDSLHQFLPKLRMAGLNGVREPRRLLGLPCLSVPLSAPSLHPARAAVSHAVGLTALEEMG